MTIDRLQTSKKLYCVKGKATCIYIIDTTMCLDSSHQGRQGSVVLIRCGWWCRFSSSRP
jgi:hypothetical protein